MGSGGSEAEPLRWVRRGVRWERGGCNWRRHAERGYLLALLALVLAATIEHGADVGRADVWLLCDPVLQDPPALKPERGERAGGA